VPTIGDVRGWLRGGPDVDALLRDGLGLWPTPPDTHELSMGSALALLAADITGRMGVLAVTKLPGLVRILAVDLDGIVDPETEYDRATLRIADRKYIVLRTATAPRSLDIATGQPAAIGRPIEKLVYDLGAVYARKVTNVQQPHATDAPKHPTG
jgi:hypothetical protein